MTMEKKINMACAYVGISQAALAREVGTTPSNFNQKVKRDTFTMDELNEIAKVLGCEYKAFFEFKDGYKI